MTATTFTAFHNALAAIEIPSVRAASRRTSPPAALNTSDLPASWVNFPRAEEGPVTFQTPGLWPTFRMDLVVAFEPVGQSTLPKNWTDLLALVDECVTTFRALTKNQLGQGPVEWVVRPAVVDVGQTPYWAVVVEVTGHG